MYSEILQAIRQAFSWPSIVDTLVQSLSAGLLFLGLWLMGNKRLAGPFITAIAEGVTLCVGISHHVWSLSLIGFVLAIIQARNFFKWSKEGAAW